MNQHISSNIIRNNLNSSPNAIDSFFAHFIFLQTFITLLIIGRIHINKQNGPKLFIDNIQLAKATTSNKNKLLGFKCHTIFKFYY